MSIIKLANAGESVTWTIGGCETVAGKFGQQVKFTDGQTGDVMFIAADTAERQLSRCGLTVETAVGETLVFAREENRKTPGAAPYWSISPAGPAPAPTKRMAPPPVGAMAYGTATVSQASSAGDASLAQRREKVLAQYLILWDTVAMHMHSLCDAKNITLDAQAIQAAVATVWISWKDKGLQPDGLDAVKVSQPVPVPAVATVPEVKMPAPSGKRMPPPNFDKFPPPQDDEDSLPF